LWGGNVIKAVGLPRKANDEIAYKRGSITLGVKEKHGKGIKSGKGSNLTRREGFHLKGQEPPIRLGGGGAEGPTECPYPKQERSGKKKIAFSKRRTASTAGPPGRFYRHDRCFPVFQGGNRSDEWDGNYIKKLISSETEVSHKKH